jgi:HAD superfamily hydrolase (TIGR01549 family)
MKKKVVIFDFDGTIADTVPYIFHFIQGIAGQFGHPALTQKEFDEARNLTYRQIIKKYHVPLIKIPFYMLKGRWEMARKINDISVCVGVAEMLRKLKEKGFNLRIVSTNAKGNIEKFIKHHHLEYFDSIDSVFNIFNKAKSLKRLMNKNGWDQKEVIYVGDEVRDIEAGRIAGIDVISVTWGLNTKALLAKNNPAYIVDKPEEILKLL